MWKRMPASQTFRENFSKHVRRAFKTPPYTSFKLKRPTTLPSFILLVFISPPLLVCSSYFRWEVNAGSNFEYTCQPTSLNICGNHHSCFPCLLIYDLSLAFPRDSYWQNAFQSLASCTPQASRNPINYMPTIWRTWGSEGLSCSVWDSHLWSVWVKAWLRDKAG